MMKLYFVLSILGSLVFPINIFKITDTLLTKKEIFYNINYNLNNGINNINNPLIINQEKIILLDPIKEGYKFLGWFKEDTEEQITEITKAEQNEDINVYAKWELIKYNINYNLNGGINNLNNIEEYTNNLILSKPTKEGYNFLGWFREDTNELVTSLTKENINIYAKWEPITYNIKYILNNGTNNTNNPSIYTIETNEIKLLNPTKAKENFNGWYLESNYKTKVTSIPTNSNKDITLYARGTKYKESYNSTYNLNGGINNTNNINKFNPEKGLVLENPTKESYKFGGWYTDKNFKTKITKISVGTTKDITLYARWIYNEKYKPIHYDISGLKFYQKNSGKYKEDCAITSITIQRTLMQGIKDNTKIEQIYQDVWKTNGSRAYIGNWSKMKIVSTGPSDLKLLYEKLLKAPVIVQRTGGSTGTHYSVVYAYEGDLEKIEKSGFKVYDVAKWYNENVKNDLVSWSNYKGGHLSHILYRS